MIELIINGQHLPVRQQPLSFRFKNPILHKADGSIIYNIDILINPLTREVFNYANRLQAKTFGDIKLLLGELIVNGCALGTVSLKVDAVSGEYFKVSAGINRGLFNYTIQDVELRDLLKSVQYTLPSTSEGILNLVKDSVTTLVDDLPFIMYPVRNEKAYSFSAGWQSIIAEVETEPGYGFQNYFSLSPDLAAESEFANTPFFKLNYIISELVKALGFNLQVNELNKIEELTRLTIYSNNYQFITGKYHSHFNGVWRVGDFMPKMTVRNFIETIETIFNAKILPDTRLMNARFVLLDRFFDPTEIKDLHVKEDAVSEIDFLKKQDSYQFNYGSPKCDVYDSRVTDFRDGDYEFKGTVPTGPDLPSPSSAKWGEVYQVLQNNAYYVMTFDEDDTPKWELLSLDYIPVLIGNKKNSTDISADFSPVLLQFNTAMSDTETASTPIVSTPAFGSIYNGPYADVGGVRLVFYRGIFYTTPGVKAYPFASSDNRLTTGVPIAGAEYAIRWQGPGGFLEKFWPKRLRWMKSSNIPIQCKKMISLQELSTWDWESGYLIGSRKCMSSIIEGEILPNGTVKANIELYPL